MWQVPITMLLAPSNLDELLAGVNLHELERLGAVSRMSISRWRRGVGVPQHAAVVRLAHALGLDVGAVTKAIVGSIVEARSRRTHVPSAF